MPSHPRSDLRAFTLVELLVVIAIIALLVSILLPSLANAREQGKTAKCMSNLKDIAGAAIAYSMEDSKDYLMPVHHRYTLGGPITQRQLWLRAGMQRAFGGRSGLHDYGVSGGYNDGLLSTLNGFGPSTRPLNKFLYPSTPAEKPRELYEEDEARLEERQEYELFRCPSDVGWNQGRAGELVPYRAVREEKWWGTSIYDLFGNSYYGATTFIVGGGQPNVRSIGVALRPMTQIPNPGRTLLYYETTGIGTETFNHFANPYGDGRDYTEMYVIGNHGGFNNIASSYADGHAEFAQRLVRTDAVSFNPDGTVNHSGNYQERGSYINDTLFPVGGAPTYLQVIFGGDNWQMHCFPAPVVDTGFPF